MGEFLLYVRRGRLVRPNRLKGKPHADFSFYPAGPGVVALQREHARTGTPERPRTCRHRYLAFGDRPRRLEPRALELTPPHSRRRPRTRALLFSGLAAPLLQRQHVRQFAVVVRPAVDRPP